MLLWQYALFLKIVHDFERIVSVVWSQFESNLDLLKSDMDCQSDYCSKCKCFHLDLKPEIESHRVDTWIFTGLVY